MLLENRIIEIANLFRQNNIQYKNLYGFHNQVYLISGDNNFILRIASTNHRSKEETLSEIDFILFLKKMGVAVSTPLQGLSNEYVFEILDGDKKYIASAFEIASGKDFRSRPADNNKRIMEVGRMLGKLHKYSKLYKPHKVIMRRQWNESQHLKKAGGLFEKNYPALKIKFDEFMLSMNNQLKDIESYGLIHGDYLFSNYFFDNDNITIIDFDECEYSWFIYDIAVCMYYYLLGGDPSELSNKIEEAECLLFNLLSGYTEENNFDAKWIENINLFFKLREYVLMSTMSETSYCNLNGWQKSFFDGALDRQINDKPFINTNFVKIYNKVLKYK